MKINAQRLQACIEALGRVGFQEGLGTSRPAYSPAFLAGRDMVRGWMEEAGLETEYILCSGDPDSLDAVVFPDKAAAIVDGTAPHMVVP